MPLGQLVIRCKGSLRSTAVRRIARHGSCAMARRVDRVTECCVEQADQPESASVQGFKVACGDMTVFGFEAIRVIEQGR